MLPEPFAQVAEDEVGGVPQRPLGIAVDEADQAIGDRLRRQPIEVELVGKCSPHTLAVDERAALHFEDVSRQPALGDELAHVRIAGMQPMAGPIEGKPRDLIGPHQPAHPILGLQDGEIRSQLARAGEAGEPSAHDDGLAGPGHGPASITKRRDLSLADPLPGC